MRHVVTEEQPRKKQTRRTEQKQGTVQAQRSQAPRTAQGRMQVGLNTGVVVYGLPTHSPNSPSCQKTKGLFSRVVNTIAINHI